MPHNKQSQIFHDLQRWTSISHAWFCSGDLAVVSGTCLNLAGLSSGSSSGWLNMSWFQIKKQQLLGNMFLSWWKKEPQESWQKLLLDRSLVSTWLREQLVFRDPKGGSRGIKATIPHLILSSCLCTPLRLFSPVRSHGAKETLVCSAQVGSLGYNA